MTTKQILDRPHTLNLSIPQALRAAIQEAREVTGETVVGFIRAAIVDRVDKVWGLDRTAEVALEALPTTTGPSRPRRTS